MNCAHRERVPIKPLTHDRLGHDRMSDTQLASGLLFYRLTKIQTQNKMPKCPLAPHAEKPLSKQGKYKVKFKKVRSPIAQWVKRWPTDLADRVRSSLKVKSSQP